MPSPARRWGLACAIGLAMLMLAGPGAAQSVDAPLGGPALDSRATPSTPTPTSPTPLPTASGHGVGRGSLAAERPRPSEAPTASGTATAAPLEAPTALGPPPFDLGRVRTIRVGASPLPFTPLRVGNLDVLAPLVEAMGEVGVSVTRVEPRNLPGNPNQPGENQFFQVNLPTGEPIVMEVGAARAWIERREVPLRAAPLVMEGRLMLPVFSLAPLIGAATRLRDDGSLVLTPTVQSVEIFPVRQATAVTIKASRPIEEDAIKVQSSGGANPRVWIDLAGYSMGFDAGNTTMERLVAVGAGSARGARVAQPSFFPDVTRVVIDLARVQRVSVQRLPDPTLIALVLSDEPASVSAPSVPEIVTAPVSPLPPSVGGGSLAGWTIVVDPGHGGTDPGALGAHITEAALNLAVARRLAHHLRSRGASVLMTRDDDRTVSLAARTSFANSRRADLFISVHHNGSVNRNARGTQTFYSSVTSLNLAREVHRHMLPATGFANRGISSARYYVIRNTTMPGVLLEGGFVTTPAEENVMISSAWQDKVARAVADGVTSYASIYGRPTR